MSDKTTAAIEAREAAKRPQPEPEKKPKAKPAPEPEVEVEVRLEGDHVADPTETLAEDHG